MKTDNMKIGFTGFFTLLLIAFKLTNVITWSWVWVLAPLWIPIALALLVVVIVMIATIFTK